MAKRKKNQEIPNLFEHEARVDFLLNKVHQNMHTNQELAELMGHLTPVYGEMAGDFIATSHPNYGKPDKDGLITLI